MNLELRWYIAVHDGVESPPELQFRVGYGRSFSPWKAVPRVTHEFVGGDCVRKSEVSSSMAPAPLVGQCKARRISDNKRCILSDGHPSKRHAFYVEGRVSREDDIEWTDVVRHVVRHVPTWVRARLCQRCEGTGLLPDGNHCSCLDEDIPF